jgi:hypothetical protein
MKKRIRQLNIFEINITVRSRFLLSSVLIPDYLKTFVSGLHVHSEEQRVI